MLKVLRDRILKFLSPREPWVSENSSVESLLQSYPGALTLLGERFRLRLSPEDSKLSLAELSQKYALPPPQILYMEIQLHAQGTAIRPLSPLDAKALLNSSPRVKLLDVREPWEWEVTSIAGSQRLTPELFAEIVADWDRATPMILYCHFGVRSHDAAIQLSARGFTAVKVLQGGIESWALHVDSNVKRYEGSWC